MEKGMIRQEVLAKLNRLAKDPVEKMSLEKALQQKLFTSQLWQEAKVIGVTLSTFIELNTSPILTQAWREGKEVAVPKVVGKGEMVFIKINSGTKFEESSFGIKEPIINDIIKKEAMDLIIVPGVAFRLDGYRVGFGGGFYDRYLTNYHGQTCSLVLPAQLGYEWEATAYDIPVGKLFRLTNKH